MIGLSYLIKPHHFTIVIVQLGQASKNFLIPEVSNPGDCTMNWNTTINTSTMA